MQLKQSASLSPPKSNLMLCNKTEKVESTRSGSSVVKEFEEKLKKKLGDLKIKFKLWNKKFIFP